MKVALLTRAALAAAAACFVVLGAAPAPAAPIPGAADQVLALVNQERSRAGLAPVSMDAQLNSCAQSFAEYMGSAGFYAHNGPDGSTPLSRMNAAGFPGTGAWGENIAAAYATAAEVMQAWMNSPGHRSNILNPSFTHIGIGAAQVAGSQWKNYWTQSFGARQGGGGSGAGGPVGGPVPQPQPQVQAPSLTQVQPGQGAVGSTVTLTGRNFGQTPGTVSFSGTAGQVVSWSDTSIQARVPNGASTGGVYVQNSRGTSNGIQFTVVSSAPAPTPAPQPAAPQAAYVYPAGANPGTRVTIYGRGFGSSAGQVQFNGVAGQVVFWYDSLIGVNVPSGATSGALKVRTAGGAEANPLQFTVDAGDPAATQPQLTHCLPAAGAVGTQVSVMGRNLGSSPGTISFNGVAATVLNWTSTAVVVIVPQGASTGQVKAQTGGGASNSVGFTVLSAGPQPQPQPGGTSTPGLGSYTGRSPYGYIRYPTPQPAPAPAPAPAPTYGGTPPSGQGGTAAGGAVTPAPSGQPTVTSLSPAAASPGATVSIRGSGFGSSRGWVRIGRVAAPVISWSDSQIVVQVPAGIGTSGQIVVRVIRPDYKASWPVYLGLRP
jgi:hypothetical protein